ncbi:hypothetical protein H4R27_000760 [Coemansia aciculifera]|nr:hypothetical protein H4R27_000760 [Coemansia aciculifera]
MAVSLEGPLSSTSTPKVTTSAVAVAAAAAAAVQIRSVQIDSKGSGHKPEWDAYWANGGREYDQRGPSVALQELLELVEAAGGASALAGKLLFAVENFFTFKPLLRFTIAYEYGLFSAIAPSQRQQWADAYARMIVPQGSLIVVLFPLIHRGQSPPYQVTMAECEHYLKRYFVLLRVDPNCRCIEGQEGNELVSVWKRL